MVIQVRLRQDASTGYWKRSLERLGKVTLRYFRSLSKKSLERLHRLEVSSFFILVSQINVHPIQTSIRSRGNNMELATAAKTTISCMKWRRNVAVNSV